MNNVKRVHCSFSINPQFISKMHLGNFEVITNYPASLEKNDIYLNFLVSYECFKKQLKQSEKIKCYNDTDETDWYIAFLEKVYLFSIKGFPIKIYKYSKDQFLKNEYKKFRLNKLLINNNGNLQIVDFKKAL